MNVTDKEIEAQLPLTEATFFILLSLGVEAKHGYAIMKEVERLSSGRVIFGTGTLYGALKRMLDQGWIKRLEDDPELGGRPRKEYSLTDLGSRILAAESSRIQSLAAVARVHLSGGTP